LFCKFNPSFYKTTFSISVFITYIPKIELNLIT
jgi:hypothetical protein